TTRAPSCGLSWTAVMSSRSFPKSALVPVTNRISRPPSTGSSIGSGVDKVAPPDLDVGGQVAGRGPPQHRLVVGGPDLTGARPLHPRVGRGERGTGGDGLGGHDA